jgi:hypothetical protein
MKHYLEIRKIDRGFEEFFEIILHTGNGAEVYARSHSYNRIVNQAEHIADVLALDSTTRMKIIDNAGLVASVPLVESFAKMRNS